MRGRLVCAKPQARIADHVWSLEPGVSWLGPGPGEAHS